MPCTASTTGNFYPSKMTFLPPFPLLQHPQMPPLFLLFSKKNVSNPSPFEPAHPAPTGARVSAVPNATEGPTINTSSGIMSTGDRPHFPPAGYAVNLFKHFRNCSTYRPPNNTLCTIKGYRFQRSTRSRHPRSNGYSSP